MPIVSKAQQRWMFENKPEMAKRWAAETPDMKSLPERVSKKKPKRKVANSEFWASMQK